VTARPRALVGAGVAVVGGRHESGDEPLTKGPELILGQGLGREHEEGGVVRAFHDRFDDRELIAE